MAGHTSEKRWVTKEINGIVYTGISEIASGISVTLVDSLTNIEGKYQELVEIYAYAGGTDTDLAELLFTEEIAARSSPFNVASTEEIAKCTDLVAAMTSAHEIYQCANNVAVVQEDRFAALRRMS